MAKIKTVFRCTECQFESVRWVGCCPSCNVWNSFIEHTNNPLLAAAKSKGGGGSKVTELYALDQISTETQPRMIAGVEEWDRVLGGGILPGSFIILTGDPGIGKSTLLLQIADKIAQKLEKNGRGTQSASVLYFSSEESLQQVKNRADRLHISSRNLRFSDQSCLESIIETTLEARPDLIILDSIQNCHFASQPQTLPGTIAQLREAAFHLMRLAKENNIAVLITGHITKEGQMAGPKMLEHMVDGVFYLQGEDRWQTRILRSVKNRFGTINEIGFFEMQEEGLAQVTDINQQLLSEVSASPGSVLICTIEGSRPLLLEVQALCVESRFGMPQRVVTGLDPKRVVLIAAILEKYLHIKLSSQDIFFKVSGGFKVNESASDLGIALALLSTYFQKPLPEKSIAIGEISLTGQVKGTNQTGMRIKEAEKFGIKKILTSPGQKFSTVAQTFHFQNVYELLALFPEE